MSAEHHCPHCHEQIWYHPKKFHEQVKCLHCKNSFGFKLYTTGPRIEAALQQQLLEKAGQRQKKNDSFASRQQRRPTEVPAAQRAAQQEAWFRAGLVDACPRCGFEPTSEGAKGEAERVHHLRHCADERVHTEYAEKLAASMQKKAVRERNEGKQEEVERLAAHKFLGGGAATAWMLTDKQLQQECKAKGLLADSGREENLSRLAASAAEASGEQGGDSSGSIPLALQGLSVEALRSVCAAHGLNAPADAAKDDIIDLLEARNGKLPAIDVSKEAAEAEEEEEEAWKGGGKDDDEEEGEEEEEDGEVDGV